MVIKQSEVVTYVCNKVIDSFKEVEELPSKLDIQAAISKIAENTEVSLGTKFVKELNQEVEIKKPLTTYYTKMSLNEIKACQEGIMREMAKVRYPKIEKEMDVIKLLKELKAICFNIRAEQIPEFFEELLEFAMFAKGEVKEPDNPKYKYMRGIYLKSEMEGCGKSTILNAIKDCAENMKLKVSEADWPLGRFGDMLPYANSNICILDDTDVSVLRNINETKLKAILRHSEVTNERKGLDGVQIEAKAAVIAAGNVEPPKAGDRCWRIFDIIPASIEDNLKENEWARGIISNLEKGEITELFNNFNFFKLFKLLDKLKKNLEEDDSKKSLPYLKNVKVFERAIHLPSILEVLNKCNNMPLDFANISANDIVKASEVINPSHPLDMWKVINTFKLLYGNDIIEKTSAKASSEYQKYNLKGLEQLKPEDLCRKIDYEAKTVKEEILENQKKWDELIAFFEKELGENPIVNNDTNLENNNNEESYMTIAETMEKLDKALELENQQHDLDNQESKMDEKFAKYTVSSHIKEDDKGKRLVLTFRDKQNPEKRYFKSYWLYTEDGLYETSASLDFSNDMKQIWQSKGRELETDEAWSRFATRLMRVIAGEKLVIDSECYLEFDEKGRILKIWAGKEE